MRGALALVTAAALLGGAAAPGVAAGAGSTLRASVATDGTQANAVARGGDPSGDGRFIAFESAASTLVGGDTNAVKDVFVRDREAGTTARVSVATGGAQANGPSEVPSISRDGRFVAFVSSATDLVPGDTNGVTDVFVHDRATGTTSRVSVTPSGAEARGASFGPQISGDGRSVVLHTYADLAGTGSDTGQVSAYRVDRTTGAVDDVCIRWDGMGLRQCQAAAVSDDGRYVAFESAAKLAADDTNNVADVYVRDLVAGTTTRASVSSAGAQSASPSFGPSISADGRVVVFTSPAADLVAGDTNGASDVFARDLASGTTERVSVSASGGSATGNSATRLLSGIASRSVSEDGRYVVFHSLAADVVAGDTNGRADVFVRDRASATTERASLSWADAQGGGVSANASISAGGRFVTFDSSSPDLVPDDTNALVDVFVRDLRPNTPPTLSLPSGARVYRQDGLSASGSFADPDLGQLWSGTVDFGEGTGPVALDLAADHTFALVHRFAAYGAYTVTVSVGDGAGGSATGTFAVDVVAKPVTFTDDRTGISLAVQLDPAGPGYGDATFTVPGTTPWQLAAGQAIRVASPTAVLIDLDGPVSLRARLDPVHAIGEAQLVDAFGARYRLVARPAR